MQKIKYIIILILTLALIFLYLQLTDYNQISNSLLQHNSSSNEKIENLESQLSTLEANNNLLEDKIKELKEKVFLLEEELVLIKFDAIEMDIFNADSNTTKIDTNETNETNTTTIDQKIPKEEKSIFDTFFKQ